jgi:enoyl-CoA hydratase/carnithine racemase
MTGKIIAERTGPVASLVFDNPERRNAVSLDMWRTVEQVLAEFAADAEIRVMLVAGAGDKAFVSGADISRFESERAGRAAVAEYNASAERAYAALYAFPRPTIAKIRGACIGGGVNLAVCCDLRLCGEGSRFAVPAAKLGLGYGLHPIQRLASVIGTSRAMEMLYTARTFTAQEAAQFGLVHRAVPEHQLEGTVDEYAAMIAANAPLTIAAAKAVVGELRKEPAARDQGKLQRIVDACFESQDYIEGRRAFMEKRKPRFTGA